MSNLTRLATLEELIDADALRSMIAAALVARPIDEQSVRRGVLALDAYFRHSSGRAMGDAIAQEPTPLPTEPHAAQ